MNRHASPCAWCPAKRVQKTGKEESTTVPFPAENPQRWFHLKASPIRNTQGEITHIVESARDITERKKVEEALRKSEALLEKSQAIARVGSWAFDVAADQLTWSDEVYRIFGVDRGDFELTYETFVEHIHPDDRAVVDAAYTESLQEGRDTYEIKHRIVHGATGEVRFVHEKGEHVRDASGQVVRSVGMVQDVTERKRTEQALIESERRFRKLFEEAQIGIALVNRKREIQVVNPFMCRWLGYTEAELLTLSVEDITLPEDIEKENALTQELREGKRNVVRFEKRYLTKSGDIVWGDLVTNIVHDNDGRYLFGLGTVVDITARKRAEEALRRREQEFSALVEDAADMIVRFDTELRHVYCNPAVEQRLGVPLSTFLGKTPLEITSLNERGYAQFIMRSLEQVLGSGEDMMVEQSYPTPSGVKYFQTHIVPEKNPQGEIEYLLAISRDITERRRTEEALQQAHQWLRAFFENSPRLASVFDQHGRYLMVNSAIAEMLGRPPEEIEGKTFAEVLPPEAADVFMQRVERLLRDPTPLSVDDQIPIEGEIRTFETILFPLSRDSDGVATFGAIASDVTQREKMQQALRESKERLSLALEGAELGMWDWNVKTGELTLNERWAEMLGYTLDEVDLHVSFWETLLYPDDAPAVMEALDAHLAGETPIYQTEHRLRTKSGAWKWILDTGKVLMRDEAGEPLRAVGTHQDITERKRAEEELARYADDLKRSNEELEQFAYVVSHDLQEPARMVESYLQLLHRRYHGALDEKADSFIDYAVDGARRMQEMIQALLNLSRVKTRGRAFTPCNTEIILEHTLKALSRTIAETGATITHDPLPTVRADRGQLAQVFQNLIANALKFRREGTAPRVHISAERRDDVWLFSVADNGIGIDPKHAERIFHIFQRLHTRESYPGTGIGLALCQKIVERHGGRIWVSSAPGEGATFFFTLPQQGDAADR